MMAVRSARPKLWASNPVVHGWPRRLRFPGQRAVGCFVPDHGSARITGWLSTFGKSGINDTFPFDPLGMGADNETMKLKERPRGEECVQALVLREEVRSHRKKKGRTNVMNLPINLA